MLTSQRHFSPAQPAQQSYPPAPSGLTHHLVSHSAIANLVLLSRHAALIASHTDHGHSSHSNHQSHRNRHSSSTEEGKGEKKEEEEGGRQEEEKEAAVPVATDPSLAAVLKELKEEVKEVRNAVATKKDLGHDSSDDNDEKLGNAQGEHAINCLT